MVHRIEWMNRKSHHRQYVSISHSFTLILCLSLSRSISIIRLRSLCAQEEAKNIEIKEIPSHSHHSCHSVFNFCCFYIFAAVAVASAQSTAALIPHNAKCKWHLQTESTQCYRSSSISVAVAMNAEKEEKLCSFARTAFQVCCLKSHSTCIYRLKIHCCLPFTVIYTDAHSLVDRYCVARHNIFKSVVRIVEENGVALSYTLRFWCHCARFGAFAALWCALLSNWEWDEAHNGMKYIGNHFQFSTSEIKSLASTLSLSLSLSVALRLSVSRSCQANDAITGFRHCKY